MTSPSASLRTMSRAEAEGTEPGGEAVCGHDSGRVIAGDQGPPGDTPGRRSSAPGAHGSGTPASTTTASSRWPTGRRCPSTRSPVTRARRRSTSPPCRRSRPATAAGALIARARGRGVRRSLCAAGRSSPGSGRSRRASRSLAGARRGTPASWSPSDVSTGASRGPGGRDARLRRPAAGSRRTAGPRRRPPRA
jgi:hypothetical protein